MVASISSIDDPARLVDTVAAQAPLKLQAKQAILETFDVEQRVQRLLADLEAEIEARAMDKRIRGRVKKQMEKSQREFYLNEQIKAIHKELGNLSDAPSEFDNLQARIDSSGMSKEAKKKANAELAKLKLMAPMSAEATVVRSYLDWMLSVPWKKKRRVRRDLKRAQEILDEDHFGLEDVKERVLEYLAVQSRVNKVKGPVLCLVGAPAWARPRSVSRSPAPRTESSSEWPWGESATRPRFADIGGPTSAPCLAKSCRRWPRPGSAIRFSCWTRWTRWAWTSG